MATHHIDRIADALEQQDELQHTIYEGLQSLEEEITTSRFETPTSSDTSSDESPTIGLRRRSRVRAGVPYPSRDPRDGDLKQFEGVDQRGCESLGSGVDLDLQQKLDQDVDSNVDCSVDLGLVAKVEAVSKKSDSGSKDAANGKETHRNGVGTNATSTIVPTSRNPQNESMIAQERGIPTLTIKTVAEMGGTTNTMTVVTTVPMTATTASMPMTTTTMMIKTDTQKGVTATTTTTVSTIANVSTTTVTNESTNTLANAAKEASDALGH